VAGLYVGTARIEHPEVAEIVPSAHCVKRFRERYPVREAGGAVVAAALIETLEGADVSGWPPAWAVSDRPAELWAFTQDVAFPLARTDRPHRWVAVTCLRR
jgi:hypothetical protein